MINFDLCEKNKFGFYDGASKKISVIVDGKKCLLKIPEYHLPKNELETSYSNSIISEYICCKIIKESGIPVQDVILGTYHNEPAVACVDFTGNGFELQEFSRFANSFEEVGITGRTPKLNDLEKMFINDERLSGCNAEANYWSIFVVDAFLGNFDRHSGNWGYLVNADAKEIKTAPIYDCGSCLYPQLTDDALPGIMADEEKIEKRISLFPAAALSVNEKKVRYKEFLLNTENPILLWQIKEVVERFKMVDFKQIVNETPMISDVRKEFYNFMLDRRMKEILIPAYERALEKTLSFEREEIQQEIEHTPSL